MDAPSIATLLVPIVIIPLMLLTLGLGFMLALFNGIVRDIGNVLSLLLTFLLFLTPVLYVKPTTGILATLTNYNPLYYLVLAPRDLVLTGTISEWNGYLIASVMSVIVFIVCLVVFHLTETRVAERI